MGIDVDGIHLQSLFLGKEKKNGKESMSIG